MYTKAVGPTMVPRHPARPRGLGPELLGPVGKEKDRGRKGPDPWVPISIQS